MAIIKQAFDSDNQQRYNKLVAKRRKETLTPEEHAELIRLSDRYEEYNAARIAALVELAQERGVTLAELMAALDGEPDSMA